MAGQPAPIRRRKLAIRLTELRKSVPKSQVETASWTGLSQSTISKIENAVQPIEVKHVRLLAQCYGVNSPEVDQLLRMAAESDNRGLLVDHSDTMSDFARDYFELEAYAEELRVHEPVWVFGLFQTPAYIRAVHLDSNPNAGEEALRRSVALRVARQERLKADRPPVLRVVLDEAVLHRVVGGPVVMAEQLAHLAAISEKPNVTLQIVPFAAGSHLALGAGFTVLRFEDTPTMDVVYVQNLLTASYLEKPSDLEHYVRVFQEITRRALGPDDSRALLDTLRRTLWEQPEQARE
jgi:transcriptional regulator with XRE-family HTH domain